MRALAARRRLTEWPRPCEPLVLVQEEFWCGWRPPTGCEVMRPTGSHDEIGLVAWTWKTHSRFAARRQEARRTRPGRPRPATACSTLIPRTMMADWAGALKPGPAGHRRCRGGCGLDRAGPVTPRSTIGMRDAEVLGPSKSINCARKPVYQSTAMGECSDRRTPSTKGGTAKRSSVST